MQINTKILRSAIIDLLDDPHGINEAAWVNLNELCLDLGWNDIVDKIDNAASDLETTELRFWLNEDDAEDLRNTNLHP